MSGPLTNPLKWVDRSFGGKLFRPTPEVHFDPNGSLILVTTPWGQRSGAKRLNQSIIEFFHSSQADKEVTSPFQKLTCLSPQGNSLRTSVMLANDMLYREDNRGEYVSGVELFAASVYNHEFTWLSVGQPHVLLLREGRLNPLSVSIDASLSLSHLSPLPQNVLGVYSTSNFAVQSLRLQTGDQILLLSRTDLPAALFNAASKEQNLEGLSLALAKDDESSPFWLGIISF